MTTVNVALIGDTHGDKPFLSWIENWVVENNSKGADIAFMVSMGDYGYFPNLVQFAQFIEAANEMCKRLDLMWLVLRGNHDDVDSLNALPLDENGLGIIASNLRFLPQGYKALWGETTVLVAGGAVSVDRASRTLGQDYFPNEALSFSEVYQCLDAGEADVLLSHDAPSEVIIRDDHHAVSVNGQGVLLESEANRRALSEIVAASKVHTVYYGHHHTRSDSTVLIDGRSINAVGLGMNGQDEDAVLLVKF